MKEVGERSPRVCFWCGAEAPKTRDHVFPRCLFPDPMPAEVEPLTVPACEKHNHAFSLHEEYFRDFVLSSSYAHPEARAIWDEKTTRALQRSPKYRAMLAKAVHEVDVTSGGGVFLGRVSVVAGKVDRVNLVLRKILNGLYFAAYGECLKFPELTAIQIRQSSEFAPFEKMFDTLPLGRQGHIRYKFARTDEEPRATLGAFFLFEKVFFLVVTDPRDGEVDDPLKLGAAPPPSDLWTP